MTPPRFWAHDGILPHLLSPLSALVARSTARRVARPGWRAPVPVLCCGNASVGGAGKTTLALDLVRRLQARGVAVHCLTRGYGGRTRGVVGVEIAMHDAALVGDEPMLLAAAAPTWVSADRAAGARAAVAAGAGMLVMDDGLQNPGLVQDLALLVVDGASGFGNGRVLPAGPLREPVSAAAKRCRTAVLVGPDVAGARAALPPTMPVLTARLTPDQPLQGRRVLAFAGIARPSKFFQMLHDAGAEVAATIAFPDHHRFTAPEMNGLLRQANALHAEPATTPKDAVRLSPTLQAQTLIVGVSLAWDDPTGIEALLDTLQ